MAFTLASVVPWGRSFEEYVAMFALSERDFGLRILGCADGPASFNAVLTRRGGRVISVDPIYQFSKEQLRARIDETYDRVLAQVRANQDEFVWKQFDSVEALGRARMAAMETFLDDYEAGLREGRYVVGELPELAFPDNAFDLALCSHFLFLYGEQLSAEFHLRSIQELCGVAAEVRIFPLLENGARPSRHLDEVVSALSGSGYTLHIEQVAYEFQKGGNQMLRVRRALSQD